MLIRLKKCLLAPNKWPLYVFVGILGYLVGLFVQGDLRDPFERNDILLFMQIFYYVLPALALFIVVAKFFEEEARKRKQDKD